LPPGHFLADRSASLRCGSKSHGLLPHHNRLAIAVAPDQRALARPISPSTEGPFALVRFLSCRRTGILHRLAPGHTVEAPRSDIHLCVLERLHHSTRSLNTHSLSSCEYLVQIAVSCGLLLKSRRELWHNVCVCTVSVAKRTPSLASIRVNQC
jgi:hypothetical protein